MRDVLLEVIPDAHVALSSETRPKFRELGRFVTTAVRAALLPVVGDYLERPRAQAARRRLATRRCSSSRSTAA